MVKRLQFGFTLFPQTALSFPAPPSGLCPGPASAGLRESPRPGRAVRGGQGRAWRGPVMGAAAGREQGEARHRPHRGQCPQSGLQEGTGGGGRRRRPRGREGAGDHENQDQAQGPQTPLSAGTQSRRLARGLIFIRKLHGTQRPACGHGGGRVLTTCRGGQGVTRRGWPPQEQSSQEL